MSAKPKSVHRCSECGAEHPKWAGRCDSCGEWNTLVEEITVRRTPASSVHRNRAAPARNGFSPTARPLREITGQGQHRFPTGLKEFDFVLGGGVFPGSVVLVGGEPGIGKSTLLLQIAGRLEKSGHRTLYVSGEESPLQVKARSERLADGSGDVALLAETEMENILTTAGSLSPAAMIVDSIQTVFTPELEGAPGNVGQVRECAARLMRFAKESGTAVFLVGHVTRGGGIAGPKTLEHIVDTVLYFEGEGSADYRVLRAFKNRFGSVDEIGVFRMTGSGLETVENPSELFLGDRHEAASGSAVTALMEGTRPLLVEIQALAARAGFGTPQRASTGYDSRRLALLLAVLDKRESLSFSQLDVFVNVVGGLRVQEPAGDLAVVAALASSVYDRTLPADTIFFGEVGLGGEVRRVSQAERRLAEAHRMGIRVAYTAERSLAAAGKQECGSALEVVGIRTVRELFARLFP